VGKAQQPKQCIEFPEASKTIFWTAREAVCLYVARNISVAGSKITTQAEDMA
jgi:hypothetical protein